VTVEEKEQWTVVSDISSSLQTKDVLESVQDQYCPRLDDNLAQM